MKLWTPDWSFISKLTMTRIEAERSSGPCLQVRTSRMRPHLNAWVCSNIDLHSFFALITHCISYGFNGCMRYGWRLSGLRSICSNVHTKHCQKQVKRKGAIAFFLGFEFAQPLAKAADGAFSQPFEITSLRQQANSSGRDKLNAQLNPELVSHYN
ncbi:uncharacterized protein EI90DRAFT_3050844 [Cantharellus anzutake]|uniref:uncharacterized protein n=1 Tax=Cantharellus anzutake TaxID=1750568 RepID=UPI0019047CF4|nr:uncharacterized protein EI90DRAFT_3050844 [Cantharellus anzutake]KAF8334057.1 hypothetical protein EI90DRAFT_3050844 [Cantharellus anzutake]